VLFSFLIQPLAWSLEFTQQPNLTMNPNGTTPLAGVVQFTTDLPTRSTLNISDGIDSWTREFATYQTVHALPVLGLKPNNIYTVELIVTDEEDNQLILSSPLQAETEPLPDDFPNISVLTSQPENMESGYTLIDRFYRYPTNATDLSETPDSDLPVYSIILDNNGEVVWYSTVGSRHMEVLPNGNIRYLLSQNHHHDVIEMDFLGNTQSTTQLEPNSIHHEIHYIESGNIFSLSSEIISVDDYPSSTTNPNAPTQSALILDSPVVELSADGSLLNRWRLTDILSPTRISYSALSTIPNSRIFDWSHANAVIHDPVDNSLIVSIRNQDAVVKFSRATGELQWILGNHSNWPDELHPYLLTPVGTPFEWSFAQHAPQITPSGNILIFDNGNYRASPFDGNTKLPSSDSYSRAVEYSIDEQTMEVKQVWEYGSQANETYFTPSVGDADWMEETGNVLITFGHVRYISGIHTNTIGMGACHIRIVEVDHNEPANKVFEVAIYNSTPDSVILGYRSHRFPDLYATDSDNDGVPDYQDNCINHANGPLITDFGGNSQMDTDSDGYGNRCDADLNNDGLTNSQDLGFLKLAFLTQSSHPNFNPNADLNGDGSVNSLDLGIIKALYNKPPGPSNFAID
jgi:hypothetical protein